MLDTSDPLSGFQFTTIGKPPRLLNRISNPGNVDTNLATSSSPPPSPQMPASSMVPSSTRSRLLDVLTAPPPETSAKAYQATTTASLRQTSEASGTYGSDTPNANFLKEVPSNAVVPKTPVPVPTQVSPPSSHYVNPSTDCSVLRTSSSGTKTFGALPLPSPLNPPASGFRTASSGPSNEANLTQHDDTVGFYRQMLRRLKAESDEYDRREEETRQATARQQDQAARWHARADTMVENMSTILTQVERRATQLAEELCEARSFIERLQGDNAQLRKELELQRIQSVEALQLEQDRVSEAIKQAEAAIKEVILCKSEWKKNAEEAHAREEELVLQLKNKEIQAKVETEALRSQLEEQKRVTEKDNERRVAEVIEERRRLEEVIRAELGRQSLARKSQDQQSGPALQNVVQDGQATSSTTSASASNTAGGQETKMSPTGSSDSHPQFAREFWARSLPAQPGMTAASQEGKSSQFSSVDQVEPLLAVKVEETSNSVKQENLTPIIARGVPHPIFQERNEDLPPPLVPRREQSLDYAVDPLATNTSEHGAASGQQVINRRPATTTTSTTLSTSGMHHHMLDSLPVPGLASSAAFDSAEFAATLNYPSRDISSGAPGVSSRNNSAGPFVRVSPPAPRITHLESSLLSPLSPDRNRNTRMSHEPFSSGFPHDLAYPSRPATPPPETLSLEQDRLIRRYSNDGRHSPTPVPPAAWSARPQETSRRDRSPEQASRRVDDHWSPTPGRMPRYFSTTNTRNKRTREEDDSFEQPNARRARSESSESDANRLDRSPLSPRASVHSPELHEERRDDGDYGLEAAYPSNTARHPLIRDRSPSPSYPAHSTSYGYAPVPQPTTYITETEARSPQVVQQQRPLLPTPNPKVAAQSQSSSTTATAYAKPLTASKPASAKIVPRAPRNSPHEPAAFSSEVSAETEISLLKRMSSANGDEFGKGEGSSGYPPPCRYGAKRGAGVAKRGRGRGAARVHTTGPPRAKAKSLSERLGCSKSEPSLAARMRISSSNDERP